MRKKMNGQDPSSPEMREWRTVCAITRREDSTVEYGTEYIGIALVELFGAKCRALLSFASRMRHKVVMFAVCSPTRLYNVYKWARVG